MQTKDRFSSSSEDSSWSDAEDFVLENVTQIPKIEQVAHGVSSDDDAVVADPERFKRKVIRTMNKFSAAQVSTFQIEFIFMYILYIKYYKDSFIVHN